jgi:aspartate aminotransferase/aminotransferase
MPNSWISERAMAIDSSGIRKVFDLAARLKNPINMAIGQAHFPVPEAVQEACIDAIRSGKNTYSVTQGAPVLREKLQARVDAEYGHSDRKVFVTSGTSGGLVLAMWALINPGDEVILFDPAFVMYDALVKLVGGTTVWVDTYPDFRVDVDKVRAAITPRTKMILLNTPANPTGAVAGENETRELAELAAERNIALLSDEIYGAFCYEQPVVSAARFNDRTIVVDGFSKSHALTGWRVGFAHGPAEVIEAMVKLQQYSFVCAPQPAQWACAVAMDVDVSGHITDYRRKRDLMLAGLSDCYEITKPGGSFYMFPKAPRGSGTEFVSRAIENDLLIIPGGIFSQRDTHFRLAYAAEDSVLERGIDVLRRLARA